MTDEEFSELNITRGGACVKRRKVFESVAATLFGGAAVALAVFVLTVFLVGVIEDRSQAQTVMRDAKLVRLAVDCVSKSYVASGRDITDISSGSGVTSEAAAEICSLSGCDGTFIVCAIDPVTRTVTKLIYKSGNFIAEYDCSAETEWKVSKESLFIGK